MCATEYAQQPKFIADIIRCKDCIHRGFESECPMLFSESYYDEDDGWDKIIHDKTTDMGYCQYGEMEI